MCECVCVSVCVYVWGLSFCPPAPRLLQWSANVARPSSRPSSVASSPVPAQCRHRHQKQGKASKRPKNIEDERETGGKGREGGEREGLQLDRNHIKNLHLRFLGNCHIIQTKPSRRISRYFGLVSKHMIGVERVSLLPRLCGLEHVFNGLSMQIKIRTQRKFALYRGSLICNVLQRSSPCWFARLLSCTC